MCACSSHCGVVDPGAFMYAIATPDFDVYVEVCDASNVDLAAFHLPGPNNGLPVGVPQGTIYGFAPMSANNYARLIELLLQLSVRGWD